MPKVAVRAAQQCISQRIRPKEIPDADFFEVPQRLRDVLANLIGATSSDIILGNSKVTDLTYWRTVFLGKKAMTLQLDDGINKRMPS